jgi:hypothetical protein
VANNLQAGRNIKYPFLPEGIAAGSGIIDYQGVLIVHEYRREQ